ncbi:hypothetical protein ACOMHN_036110 [Nucella lapillus]
MPFTPADTCQVETTTTGTEIHQAVTASGMGHTMPGIKQGKAHTVEPTHHSASIRGRLTTHQMRKRWAGTPQGPSKSTVNQPLALRRQPGGIPVVFTVSKGLTDIPQLQ